MTIKIFFQQFGGCVNKLATLKTLMGIVLAGGTFATPMQIVAANPVEECSKELLLSYFPENFVRESLKKYNVPQDKWNDIVKELNEKDKEIVKLVEEKAAKINPNPLKDPQQRQAAVKIFRETLTDAFSTTLKKNGVTDDNQIHQILDDVQQQKAKRFAQCMENQRTKTSNAGQPQANANMQTPVTKPKTSAPDAEHDNDDLDDEDNED